MAHKKNWTDAEIAAMKAIGKSWAEIRDRTGLSVEEAKVAVERYKQPIREARHESIRKEMEASRPCAVCGRRSDEHIHSEQDHKRYCPVRSGRSGMWHYRTFVDPDDTSELGEWEMSDPQLFGRYRSDALAHAREEAVRAGKEPPQPVHRGSRRPVSMPGVKPERIASRLRKQRLKKRIQRSG